MVLHIFPEEKFTKGFIEFINFHFDKNDNTFFLYRTNAVGKTTSADSNVFYIEDNKKQFKEYLRISEMVVVHLFSFRVFGMIFKVNPLILKKTKWVVWGCDIYNHQDDKIKNLVKGVIVRHIKSVGVLIKQDGEYIREKYQIKYQYEIVKYGPYNENGQIKGLKKNNADNSSIRILIGNSASITCNHTRAFDYLKKYSSDNIEIYVPLSYGDKEYAEQIIRLGRELFGKKFVALVDFMDREQYRYFLSTIDVGIFPMWRQQGMGNINPLLGMGRKIYFLSDSQLNKHYSELGYKVFCLEDISNESFEEFSRIEKQDSDNNVDIYYKSNDYKRVIEMWRKFLYE